MIETDKGHFRITFENGYTVSVFNGFGSHSKNKFRHGVIATPEFASVDSRDCEVAIIYRETPEDRGMFCTNSFIDTNDSVIGWITPEELAEIIIKVKNGEIKKVESDE